MDKRRNNLQNGITLIALVISIIVMLILAGVSLNATIGDNGIITQAQNATYMQGIATLEEFLQEKYVENYDEIADSELKITNMQLLYPEYFYIPKNEGIGGLSYIVNNDGNALYLIKKSGLPKNIRDGLVGGNAGNGTYYDYATLNDVYGVTSDLKVYYCSNGKNSIYGMSSDTLDNDNPTRTVFDNSSNPEMYNYLSSQGITGNDGKISVNDLKSINSLVIDSSSNISSLKDFYNFTSLNKLTIKDVNLSDISGISNIPTLEQITINNSNISDYSDIKGVLRLKYLYMIYVTDLEVSKICTSMENIDYPYLEYLGIFGWNSIEYTGDYREYSNTINLGKSEVTNIDPLKKLSEATKKNIKYLYLNNNKLTNIKVLKDFPNINYLELRDNTLLTSFEGLENHTQLITIYALNVGVTSTAGLKGTSGLKYFNGRYSNISDVRGFENSTSLMTLYLDKCKITSLSGLENCTSLKKLTVEQNVPLANVANIQNLTEITGLYLDGCENMIVDEVKKLENIIISCGTNYSLPSKYAVCFSNTPRIDYTNLGLTDTDINFQALKGKKSCIALNLTGNSNLSNSELQTILSSLTSMNYLSLNGCTNLSNINFVTNMPNLIELDLRGTAVTDLSKLENITTLKQLLIDNENTDMTKIPKTISRCTGTTSGWTSNSIGYNWLGSGLFLSGRDKLLTSISKITSEDFTTLTMYQASGFTQGTLNISNSKLKKIYLGHASGFTLTLPNTVTSIDIKHTASSVLGSFGDCSNLTSLYCTTVSRETICRALELCSGAPKLATVNFGDSTLGEFPANVNLPACTSMDFGCGLGSANQNVTSLKNLSSATLPKLNSLNFNYNRNLTSLSGIQYLTNLKELSCYNCRLSDIDDLKVCTKLTVLDISNSASETRRNQIVDISCLTNLTELTRFTAVGNKITSLKPLENKTKLTTLDLRDNCIYDNSFYEIENEDETKQKVIYNNIQLLARLNPNYNLSSEEIQNGYKKGNLLNLYLAGNNNIVDFAYVSNLQWNSKSGF